MSYNPRIEELERKVDAIPSGLPEYTSADAGKVLSVNSAGTGVGWTFGSNIIHLGENIDLTPRQAQTLLDNYGFIVVIEDAGEWSGRVSYLVNTMWYDDSDGDLFTIILFTVNTFIDGAPALMGFQAVSSNLDTPFTIVD